VAGQRRSSRRPRFSWRRRGRRSSLPRVAARSDPFNRGSGRTAGRSSSTGHHTEAPGVTVDHPSRRVDEIPPPRFSHRGETHPATTTIDTPSDLWPCFWRAATRTFVTSHQSRSCTTVEGLPPHLDGSTGPGKAPRTKSSSFLSPTNPRMTPTDATSDTEGHLELARPPLRLKLSSSSALCCAPSGQGFPARAVRNREPIRNCPTG
jgi:hypothetical protein